MNIAKTSSIPLAAVSVSAVIEVMLFYSVGSKVRATLHNMRESYLSLF